MSHLLGRSIPAPDFRILFESAPGLYLVLTPDFTVAAVSDAYLEATMTKRDEIVGRSSRSFQTIRTTRARPASPTSARRFWSPVNSPLLGPDGALAYIIHRVEDVTEFVRLKQRGTEQDRLAEELKTRAGAMESEIFRRAQGAGAGCDTEEILRSAERAAMLTRQLLAFSRREVLQPKVLDLNAIVGDLGKMLRRLIGETVELVVVPGDDLRSVRADPGHLEQVLMNATVNARDAVASSLGHFAT
jgi:signal transduction histidine kinase